MSRLVLVHGTSVGVKFSVFRDRTFIDGSFTVLRPMLDSGEAVLFNWHQADHEVGFWQCLNPFSVVDIYLKERKYAGTEAGQRQLSHFLHEKQPEIVVAHSLGCNYLAQSINFGGLPKSVKKVLTLASESPADFKITDSEVANRIISKKMEWLNYHCFWDMTIASSMLFTGKIPSGLFGSKESLITNRFYPQGLFGDPHTSMLRDQKFWDKLLTQTEKTD
ncbi:MAG: hypothetical protein OHK0017_08770 [Patescibacteria group bacterium]